MLSQYQMYSPNTPPRVKVHFQNSAQGSSISRSDLKVKENKPFESNQTSHIPKINFVCQPTPGVFEIVNTIRPRSYTSSSFVRSANGNATPSQEPNNNFTSPYNRLSKFSDHQSIKKEYELFLQSKSHLNTLSSGQQPNYLPGQEISKDRKRNKLKIFDERPKKRCYSFKSFKQGVGMKSSLQSDSNTIAQKLERGYQHPNYRSQVAVNPISAKMERIKNNRNNLASNDQYKVRSTLTMGKQSMHQIHRNQVQKQRYDQSLLNWYQVQASLVEQYPRRTELISRVLNAQQDSEKASSVSCGLSRKAGKPSQSYHSHDSPHKFSKDSTNRQQNYRRSHIDSNVYSVQRREDQDSSRNESFQRKVKKQKTKEHSEVNFDSKGKIQSQYSDSNHLFSTFRREAAENQQAVGCQTPNATNQNSYSGKRKYSLNEDERFYDKREKANLLEENQMSKKVSYQEVDPLTQSTRREKKKIARNPGLSIENAQTTAKVKVQSKSVLNLFLAKAKNIDLQQMKSNARKVTAKSAQLIRSEWLLCLVIIILSLGILWVQTSQWYQDFQSRTDKEPI